MSAKHGSLPVSVLRIPMTVLNISRLVSLPFPKGCRNCVTDLQNIAVLMSVWSLLASTESLSLTFLGKTTFGLRFLIRSIQNPIYLILFVV